MSPSALRPTSTASYRSLAGFYLANDARIHSRESDIGLWWRDDGDAPLHRAAWVHDTGELYMVRLGPTEQGGGRVEVLALTTDQNELELALAGWRERCGTPGSLAWLRRRAAALRHGRRRACDALMASAGAAVNVSAALMGACAIP